MRLEPLEGRLLLAGDVPTISGVLYDDANQNGGLDAGEASPAGATVYADTNDNGQLDAGESTAVTDIDGSYELIDVVPGPQVIRAIAPLGYELSSPAADLERVFLWHG